VTSVDHKVEMPEKEIDVDVCVRVCVGDFLLWINATTMQWK
jgi:hypothetical protein